MLPITPAAWVGVPLTMAQNWNRLCQHRAYFAPSACVRLTESGANQKTSYPQVGRCRHTEKTPNHNRRNPCAENTLGPLTSQADERAWRGIVDFAYNPPRLVTSVAVARWIMGHTLRESATMSVGESENFVQPQMLEDIQVLADNADRLSDIVNATDSSAASPHGFAYKVAETLELPKSVVNSVLIGLWRTKQYQTSLGVGPQEAVERIGNLLETKASGEWKKKYYDAWKKCSRQLGDLLQAVDDDHPLLISMKAQELAYTHENLLVSSRLITDIRPVFDSSGEDLRELVVTHTLFLRYSDAKQDSCVASFALDSEDVANLLSECQRAVTKTKTVRNALHEFNPIVLPEDTNGS